MKNNLVRAFVSIFLCFTLLMSCEKNINLNAPFKDITILYGLINPNDTISYMRIEKAFLSSENIYQTAKIADSNLYPHKLDVRLISGQRKIDFDTITIHDKKDGIFYAPKMLVYYANTKDLLDVNLPLAISV